MHAFNQSLKYDQRMHAADIKGSIAYARSLALVGILDKDEEIRIIAGLQAVGKEWETGTVCSLSMSCWVLPNFFFQFKIQEDDEDIHTANERRLSELVGPLGGKLHTGRSRNDQVATDMRLWLLDEVKGIEKDLRALIRVLVERADNEKDYLLPGYTHLQVCCLRCSVDHSSNFNAYREANRYGGPIFSFPMHFLSATISTVSVNLFHEFPSCLWVVAHWLAIRLSLTENFLQRN